MLGGVYIAEGEQCYQTRWVARSALLSTAGLMMKKQGLARASEEERVYEKGSS